MDARRWPVIVAGALLAVFCAISASSTADETGGKPYLDYQAPSVYRQWRHSDDGRVSVCLALKRTTFTADDGVTLHCAVRNNSDQAMTILGPFGDEFFAHSSGLCIVGPDGIVEYVGPQKDYMLGEGSFLELPPRSVVEHSLTIPDVHFPALKRAGLYTIDYRYHSAGYPRQPAPANFWTGSVDSNPVTVMVK